MAIVLKVKPDVLIAKSGEISKSIGTIEKELKDIGEVITKTKKYWEGDASNMHQKHYQAFKDDIPKVIKRLKEHPTDLLKMANLYNEAEKANKALAKQLPVDVIK
ncbi:MAG: WXG100 family type VII secretion target [Lachnospiraceae bacterium]|nr:WXG100 family type VII secretion target [Lachnospiraceae bacterium]